MKTETSKAQSTPLGFTLVTHKPGGLVGDSRLKSLVDNWGHH